MNVLMIKFSISNYFFVIFYELLEVVINRLILIATFSAKVNTMINIFSVKLIDVRFFIETKDLLDSHLALVYLVELIVWIFLVKFTLGILLKFSWLI